MNNQEDDDSIQKAATAVLISLRNVADALREIRAHFGNTERPLVRWKNAMVSLVEAIGRRFGEREAAVELTNI